MMEEMEKDMGKHSQVERGDEEKALLVIEYETGKVFWRLFIPYLPIIFMSYGIISTEYSLINNKYDLETFFSLSFFGLMLFASILLIVEMFLVHEIRFYSNRVEKEWTFFGKKSIDYTNTWLRGMSSKLASSKNFMFINKPSWYHYKCFGYDEHLVSQENKDKANKLLATISNRDISEFGKARMELNPLIKQ